MTNGTSCRENPMLGGWVNLNQLATLVIGKRNIDEKNLNKVKQSGKTILRIFYSLADLIMTRVITELAICVAKFDIPGSLATEHGCLNANASPFGKTEIAS